MAAFNVLSPPTRTCPVPSGCISNGACWNYNCRKLPNCGPFPSVVAVSEAEDRRKLNSMPSAKVFGFSNSYGCLLKKKSETINPRLRCFTTSYWVGGKIMLNASGNCWNLAIMLVEVVTDQCGHILSQSGIPRQTGSGRKPGPLRAMFPSTPAEVSSVKELFEFICTGPLLEKIGVTSEKIAESIDNWILYGSQLCRLFELNEMYLTEPQKIRIYHYYVPVFLWCVQEISHHSSLFKEEDQIPPLVIGFSAPQGCGKTTLVFALDFLFQLNGRKSATISIDDFYLTANEQAKLRESNPGNGLLEFRGNAGSHDLQLSVETLTALGSLTKEGEKIKIPRYNKHAFNGRGDRADPATWPEVDGPLTVVLFEGWMLGFKPVPVEVVKSVDPQLEIVNKNLEAYYDAWDKFIKSWIIIKIHDPVYVYQWRLQAEIAMRNDGKPGMSDEEVMDFVSRYLPAYKACLPTLYSEGPKGADLNHLLVVEIDEGRNPILGI